MRMNRTSEFFATFVIAILAFAAIAAPPPLLAQVPYPGIQPVSNPNYPIGPATFTATSQTSPTYVLGGSASGTITVTGSSLTTVTWEIDGSNDGGTTFFPLNTYVLTTPGTVATTQTTTTASIYGVNIANLNAVRFKTSSTFTATSVAIKLMISANPVPGSTGATGPVTVLFASTAADPCQNPNVAKSSVAVAISTATTTELVALSSGKLVYACGFTASIGASTTVGFSYGSGSACGTGTTALTGVFAPATGAVLAFPGEGTRFAAPASKALCAVSTGTGGINGVLSYVQQ